MPRSHSQPAPPRKTPLHRGSATIVMPRGQTQARVAVDLMWDPDPSVQFRLTGRREVATLTLPAPQDMVYDPIEIHLGRKGTVSGQGRLWEMSDRGIAVTGQLDPCTIGSLADIHRIDFDIANLQRRVPRATLDAGGWTIALDELEGARLQPWLRPPFLPTHHATLTRSDKTPFSPEAAQDVIDCLTYCLAFADEAWVGILTPTGYDASSRVTWRRWTTTTTDDIRHHGSWLPTDEPDLALSRLWAGFWQRWTSTSGQLAIKTLIPILAELSHLAIPEPKIVLDQVGLEFLSSVVVVEELSMLSSDGHTNLSAPDRLRLLLTPAGIDVSLPITFPNRSGARWHDGPQAITEIRNAIVHPGRKSRPNPAALPQAETLAHNYWLRSMLLYFHYNYPYISARAGSTIDNPTREIP